MAINFNETIIRDLSKAPERLTVNEFFRLVAIKTQADSIKADPNSKKKLLEKDAMWVSTLLSNENAPKKGQYTKFILDNIDAAYTKYTSRPMSKNRYTVYGATLDMVFPMDDANTKYGVKFGSMMRSVNTFNGDFRTMQKLGLNVITLDTNDKSAPSKDVVAHNDAVYNAIAENGLTIVDDNGNAIETFITAIHGASNMRGGSVVMMSTTVSDTSPMNGLSFDEKRIYLYKTLLNHEEDSRSLVEIMGELGVGNAKLAKMLARICVDTSGSYLVSEILPSYTSMLKSANPLYFTEDKTIDIPVKVVYCDKGFVVKSETRAESACNGEGAADTKYFIPASIIDGDMTPEEGERFLFLYKKYGESVKSALSANKKDAKEFSRLYRKLKKTMQFRVFHDGKKGLLVEICVKDFLAWYATNTDKPNMRRAYETMKGHDVFFPRELVKYNTNMTLDSLELCRTETKARGYTMNNHQFMETYPTDMSKYTKPYFAMLAGICGPDAESAAKCAISLLNTIGDRTADPNEDGNVSTNPYDLSKRIQSNYALIQEPNTRKELFRLKDKFFNGMGVGKMPMPKGNYTFGVVDFRGYVDILFQCELKNPDALKGNEVYLNGQTGKCVMNRAPVTNLSEVQLGEGVENEALAFYNDILVFSAYSGFAFLMSNGDVDGDQFHTIFGVDDMTRAIIADMEKTPHGTFVCECDTLFNADKKDQKFRGPYASDAEFTKAYKKFIVATRNSSKVGIINDAFERIASARQHLEYLVSGAKKLGATFRFIGKPIPCLANGKIQSYLYNKAENVIITTHLVRNLDAQGNPNFFLNGNCTIKDVEKVLDELRNMEFLATAAMQKEVDSAKDTGKSVKDEVIKYLTIVSTPFHMVDRAVAKSKITKDKGEGYKFCDNGKGYHAYYVSGSDLGKLNATVTNSIDAMTDNKVMVANARNLGTDMLPLLTETEKSEILLIKEKVVKLNKEYNDLVAKALEAEKNPFADHTPISHIKADIVAKACDIANNEGVSMTSVAAAMFLQKQLKSSVRISEDGSKFVAYDFCWLLGDCVTKIFARNTSNAIVPIKVADKYQGKVLTASSNWLYDDDGNKVVSIPTAPNMDLLYFPTVTAYGDTVVFTRKDNGYAFNNNAPLTEVEIPVYHCERKFPLWKTMRKANKDILVNIVIIDGLVSLKMVDEKTNETSGVIYHKDSDWGRIFTAYDMLNRTYKVEPTPYTEGKAVVLKFTLVK